ncbi:hypothetical protein Sru01_30510 [Sphaerisporangium rufum]|uniref:Uncharacterized protein n=1 Tax=Sphaerisporangium rufum TaxID=1381558 RepID=A0A919R1L0_9ACTN|nr:hypothetical protein [Sphaerisporangium rufum]GII78069.1 hypothetical protein Sru01_30510 [Sphaerisporangium rufum]
MSKNILAGAALTAASLLILTPGPASARAASAVPATTVPVAAAASGAAPAPATVARRLFRAWLRADRPAAARVATPAAVAALFAYQYRAPDEFAGCTGRVCRFRHTSVRVRGGLDGILMIVSGAKVTKVYRSRVLATPSAAARHLFAAWRHGDRYRALEAATGPAVATLFRNRYDPRGVAYHFQGCSAEPKGRACAYSYEGGALIMHVRGSRSTGYEVGSVGAIAD